MGCIPWVWTLGQNLVDVAIFFLGNVSFDGKSTKRLDTLPIIGRSFSLMIVRAFVSNLACYPFTAILVDFGCR